MSHPTPSRVLKTVRLNGIARTVGRRRAAPASAAGIAQGGNATPAPVAAPAAVAESQSRASDADAIGYAEGYERGLRDGLADAAQRVEQATREAVDNAQADLRAARDAERQRIDAALTEHETLTRQVLEQVQRHINSATRQIEEQAVAIAYEAVCRIVGDAAPQASAIQAIVARALAELGGKPALRVRLHPGDLATLQASPDAQVLLQGFPAVSWAADDSVSMGGCLVDSTAGTLDARLEVQLRALGQSWRTAVTQARSA